MTNLSISLPLSATRAGYDPERQRNRYAANAELIATKYKVDKMLGKRRTDGALKLKKLLPLHQQIVSCYINGMKGVEIAEQFDVAAITVYRILADPLAQSFISEFDTAFKDEFQRMFPLVADAVRDGLESTALPVRLKAVDRWAKICRYLDGGEEDNTGNKVAAITTARMKFVELVKSANKITQVEIEVEESTIS